MTQTQSILDKAGEADAVALVPFSPAHLDGALALSRELAWPYRIEDWAFALTVGQGFVLERAGEVIGTAAWFAYGETHATVGMIIVSGAAQGRGHGARLMDALLRATGPRSVLLNATPEGRGLYERRGFDPVGLILQHQGRAGPLGAAPSQDRVRPMAAGDLDAVLRLDGEASGLERRALIERLLAVGEGLVLLRDGRPTGYAISRLFGRGHVVGPVVASDAAEARLLIEAALARLGGAFVRIDTPASLGLGPWLAEIGLPQVSDALTMVRGSLPRTGPAELFALSNQSFH